VNSDFHIKSFYEKLRREKVPQGEDSARYEGEPVVIRRMKKIKEPLCAEKQVLSWSGLNYKIDYGLESYSIL
jgi:hypothetical protein